MLIMHNQMRKRYIFFKVLTLINCSFVSEGRSEADIEGSVAEPRLVGGTKTCDDYSEACALGAGKAAVLELSSLLKKS